MTAAKPRPIVMPARASGSENTCRISAPPAWPVVELRLLDHRRDGPDDQEHDGEHEERVLGDPNMTASRPLAMGMPMRNPPMSAAPAIEIARPGIVGVPTEDRATCRRDERAGAEPDQRSGDHELPQRVDRARTRSFPAAAVASPNHSNLRRVAPVGVSGESELADERGGERGRCDDPQPVDAEAVLLAGDRRGDRRPPRTPSPRRRSPSEAGRC